MQVHVREEALAQLLKTCASDATSACSKWLDAEGSSLIRTLGKAWGGEAPLRLSRLFEGLVLRIYDTTTGSDAGPAASQTCSLAVAYILPTLFGYNLFPSRFQFTHMHPSSLQFIPAAEMPDCRAEGCICQYLVRIM